MINVNGSFVICKKARKKTKLISVDERALTNMTVKEDYRNDFDENKLNRPRKRKLLIHKL